MVYDEPHRVRPKPNYYGNGIAVVRRSRRDRRCETCGETIRKGDEYVRHALPPHTEPFDSDRWWSLVQCGWLTSECRRYWEIDAKIAAGDPLPIPL